MARDGSVSGGRPKGAPNKRTWEARKIIEDMGFDPITALVHFARGDWQALGLPSATKQIYTKEAGIIEVDRIDEQLRQKSVKDLVPYVYPQLKAIEHSGEAANMLAQTLAHLFGGPALKDPHGNSDAAQPDADSSASG